MKIKKEKHMKYNIKYIQNKIDYNQNKIKFSDKMGYLQIERLIHLPKNKYSLGKQTLSLKWCWLCKYSTQGPTLRGIPVPDVLP